MRRVGQNRAIREYLLQALIDLLVVGPGVAAVLWLYAWIRWRNVRVKTHKTLRRLVERLIHLYASDPAIEARTRGERLLRESVDLDKPSEWLQAINDIKAALRDIESHDAAQSSDDLQRIVSDVVDQIAQTFWIRTGNRVDLRLANLIEELEARDRHWATRADWRAAKTTLDQAQCLYQHVTGGRSRQGSRSKYIFFGKQSRHD